MPRPNSCYMERVAITKHLPFFLAVLVLGLAAGCQRNLGFEVVGTLEWDRIELTAEAAEPIVAIEVCEGERVASWGKGVWSCNKVSSVEIQPARVGA